MSSKQEILSKVAQHLSQRSEMKVLKRDDKKLVTMEFKDSAPLVIVTGVYDDITPQMWHWYQRDLTVHCSKVDKAIQMTVLSANDDSDSTLLLQRIITPMFVKNRVIIQRAWADYNPNGQSVYCCTSFGNDEQYAKFANPKDVISTCHVAYTMVEAVSGGRLNIVHVLHIDVKGSLPDWVKIKIGEEQAKGIDQVVAYIRKNYNE
ncbi:hypothetical protein ScalyP_jg319 [Parmales sp. scaly parma]|nr:hypothetical protein ScalyP_jg319 [Parmales sp. scaly parma]